MPLTRATVTVAALVTLPTYVAISLAYGVVYLLDPGDRLARVNALTFQRSVLPMPAWGAMMLGLAAMMLVAFTLRSRMTFAFALSCCAVTWFLWGGMYVVSVVQNPDASILAPVLPWAVSLFCVASLLSLIKREV